MAEPRIYTQSPRPDPIRGKPVTHSLFKALVFASIVVLVPLFPSQAPEFIAESVITKFWELIHLLFIGIAVSYGIFCRRNAETEIETVSRLDSLQDDMSMMFRDSSSRFDEGYVNPYGYGDKRVNQGPIGGEEWKLNPDGSNIQAWNSQFFQGESMVIVARPNCKFGEAGESGSVGDYKPLGLPVRSLKSRVRKRESPELVSRSESGSGSLGFDNSFDESENAEFSYSGPQNLEQQFDEAVASPSPVPWHSRSGRMETRENFGDFSRHFRPLSADEALFESFGTVRTPSLRSNLSLSSLAGSVASSQDDDSPSPSPSVASELMDLKMEDEIKETSLLKSSASSGSLSPPKPANLDIRKTKSFRGSSASLSSDSPPKPAKLEARKVKSYKGSYSSSSDFPSPPNPMDDKASSSALLSRDYGYDSLYEHDPKASENRRDDLFNGKESSHMKGRGRSVRTIRSGRKSFKKEGFGAFSGNQVDENDDNDTETEFSREDTSRNEGNETPERNVKSSDNPKLLEDQTRELKEFPEDISAELEEEAIVTARISHSSSIEDVDSESVQGTRTPDSNEVDKKAGEFIAKFREQIRLQKVASINRARGLRLGSNYHR